MAAKFGTSGLRGLVEELTDGTAARHAAAFAAHLLESRLIRPGDDVFVGQDLRDSSAGLARQCMGALAAAGLSPVDCGGLPTPALALHAISRGSASLMVTGSHIPADRNGVKFYRPDGEIDKHDEACIAERATDVAAPSGESFAPHRNAGHLARSGFVKRYAGWVPPGALRGLRLGVYEHSSVARDLFADILAPSGAELLSLGRSEAFIPVDTEAVSEDIQARIRSWAAQHRLDAVISADGDGDRPLLADETGACLRGDLLGLATAVEVGADAVVTPVTSTSAIEARLEAMVLRTRVGSPFVIAGMAAAQGKGARRVVGFEANGGILTASVLTLGTAELAPLPTRDCMLPILATLAMTRRQGLALSQLPAHFRLPASLSGLIRAVPTASSQGLIAMLTARSDVRTRFFEPFGAIAALDLTDGLRVSLEGGRTLHLRPSGNAPELRIYAEATDAEAAQGMLDGAVAQATLWMRPG
ncbi:MAG: phosphomannomutase [Hyphomicrobiales bacterium]|nr:phosphomannomutase [Hyphomicrobiales bacterium]